MSTLIIYGNSTTEGNCGEILNNVERYLKDIEEKYVVLDLYKANYNPVLADKELYSHGRRDVADETKQYQKLIQESKKIIFIYPVWWFSMPAIVKGFIDRTFTAGFAFKYSKTSPMPIPLLKGKQALLLETAGGPAIMYKILEKTPINHMKAILKFCGIKSKGSIFGDCNKELDDKRKELVTKFVDKRMKSFWHF